MNKERIELPPEYPYDFPMRLASGGALERFHQDAENTVKPFGVLHAGLLSVSREVLGDGDINSVVTAIDVGARTYESLVGLLESRESYPDDISTTLALRGIYEFMHFVGVEPQDKKHNGNPTDASNSIDESSMIDIMNRATKRMETDAPRLTEAVDGLVDHRYGYEAALSDFAMRGAASMRGFHNQVNRRLNKYNKLQNQL